MKFGLLHEMQLPRPLDVDQWHPDGEYQMVAFDSPRTSNTPSTWRSAPNGARTQ